MTEKEILGVLSLLAACVSYICYFRSVLQGVTKPHAFSWITWGVLTAIAFVAQYSHHAGAGAWATGFVAVYCFIVGLLALFIGEKHITKSDWLTFLSALLIIPIWYFTQNALTAILLIIVIDALGGYYPTFRKSYSKPDQEALALYVISTFQVMLSLGAMQNYLWVNILYPAFIMIANAIFVIMVLWRRKVMAR